MQFFISLKLIFIKFYFMMFLLSPLIRSIYNLVSISPSNPEPEFQFIPLSSPDQLRESMALIHQGLENEDIIYAFDNLARDKPGETLKAANSMENVHKNRYRDIKPCEY